VKETAGFRSADGGPIQKMAWLRDLQDKNDALVCYDRDAIKGINRMNISAPPKR